MTISQIPTNANALSSQNSQSGSSSLSLGQKIGNAFGLNNDVQDANNKQLMGIANNFNNYMASTGYQRTVKDMESAGINPTIAFGLGKGQLDSSPTSALASTSSNSGTFGNLLSKFIEDFISSIKAGSDIPME